MINMSNSRIFQCLIPIPLLALLVFCAINRSYELNNSLNFKLGEIVYINIMDEKIKGQVYEYGYSGYYVQYKNANGVLQKEYFKKEFLSKYRN